jgi:inosine/xanthosine triphosphatase
MKVGLGGTFNVLHRGHRALLDQAFESGDEVVVGITSDAMARGRKPSVTPLVERREALESYLRTKGDNWTVVVIDRPEAYLDERTEISILVVSPETRRNGEGINRERIARGLVPLQLVEVPHVLADDYVPISAARVIAGDIDPEGRLLRPLRVGVGSLNPVKVGAVRSVLSRFFPHLEVSAVDAPSGVGEQPRGDSIREGAMRRAAGAIVAHDLGIGLEAGVFDTADGLYDVQFCAVLDRRGRYTIGHGMGFRYPPRVAELVRSGSTVGSAFRSLYGPERDGRRDGAIGFLTKGALDRTGLAEQAVMAAMVPRIRKELYDDL